MPSLNTNVRSFSEYKSLLYGALTTVGFNPRGDISARDIDQAARAQVVVAGNNFFLSLSLQISFPSATIEVEKKRYFRSGGRLHSQDVYHPILSFDAGSLGPLRTFEYLTSSPNWGQAAGDIDMLVDHIWRAYTDYMEKGLYKESPWWPSSLTEIQKQILTTVLDKGGINQLRLTALRELLN